MSRPELVSTSDTALMAALHARSFPAADAWSEKMMSESLTQPQTQGWLVRGEQELQGFILTRLVLDEGEILTLAVEPQAQRRGIGRTLLRQALASLAVAGAVRLHLEVAEDNSAALALYRQAGFAQVGQRAGYYASGRAALLLSRDLKSYC